MVFNSSTNQNVSEAFNLEYLEFRITKISLYILIFILSCIGNSLVAIVIIRAKGTWTSANVLILNLAVCDLMLPTLSIPFDLALEEVNYIWPFGSGMCKVLWPFQTALSTSSSLTLVAISLDRYRTIGKPLSRRVSTGKIFVFSSIMSFPSVYVFLILLRWVTMRLKVIVLKAGLISVTDKRTPLSCSCANMPCLWLRCA